MNLREAQETRMPFGIHTGKTLGAVSAADRSYLTDFLAGKIGTLDAWLGEAVALVISEGAPARVIDVGQGELFGSSLDEQSTEGEQR